MSPDFIKWTLRLAFASVVLVMTTTATADVACVGSKSRDAKGQIFRAKLHAHGYQVTAVKLSRDCYEIYALERAGKGYEIYFDPSSGSWWRNRHNFVTHMLSGV